VHVREVHDRVRRDGQPRERHAHAPHERSTRHVQEAGDDHGDARGDAHGRRLSRIRTERDRHVSEHGGDQEVGREPEPDIGSEDPRTRGLVRVAARVAADERQRRREAGHDDRAELPPRRAER
jgi:hypothetical protein